MLLFHVFGARARRRAASLQFATVAAVLFVLGVVGCASSAPSATPPDASSTTSAPCTPQPTPTAPPTFNEAVPIRGNGERIVELPLEVALPAIVHARYSGHGTFTIRSESAAGVDTAVLAVAKGGYDGTFPVGFLDDKCAPTVALHVEADGPWQLDIAHASIAPQLKTGIRGNGDAVLAYRGPEAKFRVTYSGKTSFVLRTYGTANVTFARASGATDTVVKLAAGPLFIAVTTVGTWTIAPA